MAYRATLPGMGERKLIEAGWQRYRALCIPGDASPTTVEAAHQAFLAGAAVLHRTMMAGMTDSEDIQPCEEQLMQDVVDEVREICEQLDVRMGVSHG